jgi:molybdate transport system substrate-binding protein
MDNTMNRRSFVKGAAAVAAVAAVPAGLALADEQKPEEEAAEEAGDGIELQIFAANSLEKALPEVQALYTEQHPEVTFADTQFKASGDLVEQLKAGAIVDVLITASKGTMDTAEEDELIDVDTRIDMFNNDLVIVVAEDSDLEIDSIEAVAGDDIASIAIGDAATVPAGKYTNQSLYSVGLYSDESGADGEYAEEIAGKVLLADKVGTCASYVSTGDADCGFVYSSDVYRYDGIKAVYTTPADSHKTIVYPGAVVADAPQAEAAAAFLEFCMTDPDALDIWSEFGFEVVEAEDEAGEAGAYADGVYEAEGKGIGGKVPVTVTIEGGVITDVTVGDNSETQGIGSKAIEQLPALIVEANGIDGVDGVSGASVTSKAIFTAVTDALEQAAA